MATPEFEQTGSTSGQRLYRLGATQPKGTGSPSGPRPLPRSMQAADRLVSGLLARNPSIGELNQQRRRQRLGPEPRSRYADLSNAELLAALRRLQGQPSTMDLTLAEQVSRDLQD